MTNLGTKANTIIDMYQIYILIQTDHILIYKINFVSILSKAKIV